MEKIKGLFGNSNILIKDFNPPPANEEDLKPVNKVNAVFIDSKNAFNIDFAKRCAKQFNKCYYYTPAGQDWFKRIQGEGLRDEGLIRIDDYRSRQEDNGYSYDTTDLFVFCDIPTAPEQDMLIRNGKAVWGCRYSEWIEDHRMQAKILLDKMNLLVNKTVVKYNVDELEAYLKPLKDKWVKVTKFRDIKETWHWVNYEESLPILRDLRHRLGYSHKWFEFIIEDPIKSDSELGYDMYNINGEFPETITWGLEIKNEGYLTHWTAFEDMPKEFRDPMTKMKSYLKDSGCRGFVCNEERIVKSNEYKKSKGMHKVFVNDMTMRLPLPDMDILSAIITNWGEILWLGANGIMAKPKYKAKYGMMLFITSDWLPHDEVTVKIGKEIKDLVCLINYYKIDDNYVCIGKEPDATFIGTIEALGNSIEECKEKLMKYSKMVSGIDVCVNTGVIDKIDEVVEAAEDLDIEI